MWGCGSIRKAISDISCQSFISKSESSWVDSHEAILECLITSVLNKEHLGVKDSDDASSFLRHLKRALGKLRLTKVSERLIDSYPNREIEA